MYFGNDLYFREIEAESVFERDLTATLLARMLGSGTFTCDRHRKESKWRFRYWATDSEQEMLEDIASKYEERRLDEEYRKLLEGV